MKYWKNISKGWKRIHIVLSIVLSFIMTLITLDNDIELFLFIMFFWLLFYYVLVFTIEWIKDGFKK
jgi:hypothetical protein